MPHPSSFAALVLSSRHTGSTITARVFTGTKFLDCHCTEAYAPGTLLHCTLEQGVLKGAPKKDERKSATLRRACEKKTSAHAFTPWTKDACTASLVPSITRAASFLLRAIAAGTPFFIRYNADTDGICGGLLARDALQRAAASLGVPIRIHDIPSPPATYEKTKAVLEYRFFQDMGEAPVVLLIDHAANTESISALNYLIEQGASIVVIDHHPPDPRINALATHFISPFTCKNAIMPSKYTAAYLCFEVAKAVAGSSDERLLHFALQADASSLTSRTDYTEPLAIDYFAQTTPHARLDDYASLVADESHLRTLALTAQKLLQKASDEGWKNARIEHAGSAIVLVSDFNGVVRKRSFPSKGMALNLVHARACTEFPNLPIVSMCFVGDSIGFRANALALAKGFDANALITLIRTQMPRALRSGGGHAGAASLQVAEEGDRLRMLSRVTQLVREQLGVAPSA